MTAATDTQYRVMETLEQPYKQIKAGDWIKVTAGSRTYVVQAKPNFDKDFPGYTAHIVLQIAGVFTDGLKWRDFAYLETGKNREDAATSVFKIKFFHEFSRSMDYDPSFQGFATWTLKEELPVTKIERISLNTLSSKAEDKKE